MRGTSKSSGVLFRQRQSATKAKNLSTSQTWRKVCQRSLTGPTNRRLSTGAGPARFTSELRPPWAQQSQVWTNLYLHMCGHPPPLLLSSLPFDYTTYYRGITLHSMRWAAPWVAFYRGCPSELQRTRLGRFYMFKIVPFLQPRPGVAAEMLPLTAWSWTKCTGADI